MEGAGPGIKERALGSPRLTSAERAHRRALLRHQMSLVHHYRKLSRKRASAVERGTIRVLPGRPPDHIAQKVLREQVEATGPPLRPYIADAMVYSTRLGAVDRAIGVWEPDARRLVYLVV